MTSDQRRSLPARGARAAAGGLLCGALALSGCDTGDGGDAAPGVPTDDAVGIPTATIEGFYDASTDIAGVGRDVVLARVDAEGRLVEYDWQGDAVDRGADCHVVRVSTLSASADGAHTIDDGTDSGRFTLRPVEGGLEIGFVDATDLDGDGDADERLSTVLERLADRDEADLNWCV